MILYGCNDLARIPSTSCLNSFINRVHELVDLSVSEVEWKVAEKIALFMETSAALTEHQSEQKYVILSLFSVLFHELQKRCKKKHCAGRLYARPCCKQDVTETERKWPKGHWDRPHWRGYAIYDLLRILFPIPMCGVGISTCPKLWRIRLNWSDREERLFSSCSSMRGAPTIPWRMNFLHFYVLQTTGTAVSSLFNNRSPMSRGFCISPPSPKMSCRFKSRSWQAEVSFHWPKILLETIVRCLEKTSYVPVCGQDRGRMYLRKSFDDGNQTDQVWDNGERK